MKKSAIGLLVAAMVLPMASQATTSLVFNKAWTYNHSTDLNAIESEIPSFDSVTGSIWVAGVTGVDVLDLSGNKIDFIDTSSFGEVNSIAMFNGTAAFAIEDSTRTNNGIVQFYDTTTRTLGNTVTVGALPDMLTYTPDGSKLLVANEGTPDAYGSLSTAPGVFPQSYNAALNDPVGSVSIINTATLAVTTATFAGVPTTGTNIRTNTGMDFEPEYIAIDSSGTKAYVTLQEANAVGVLDISSGSFDKVVGLGVKDFSQVGNEIDVDDKDGVVSFSTQNLKGLYQPDGIATFEHNGETLYITANEGDYREDDGDLIDRLKSKGVAGDLKNLKVSSTDSNLITEDYVVGGTRDITIRDVNGNIVYSSGSILDKAAAAAGIYDDGRSDNKGVEPEDVEVFELAGMRFAAVGLERTDDGAIAIFDITDPSNTTFEQLIVTPGDEAVEGLAAFAFNGQYFLAAANERSGTTTLFNISAVPEPETYGMILAGLSLLSFVTRRKK